MSERAALERSGEKDCKGDLAILVGESLFSGFGPPFCFVCMGYSNAVWEERVCAQSCPTLLRPPWTVSPLGSSVHGISQAGILEWVAISSSRGSCQPRDRTWVSCIAGRFFTTEPPREAKRPSF